MRNDRLIHLNRILPWAGVFAVCGTVVYGMATGKFLKPLMQLAGAVGVGVLLTRPALLLLLTLAFTAGQLSLPVLPAQVSLGILSSVLFCGAVILKRITHGGGAPEAGEKRIAYWVLGFALVLVVTACVRGSGVRLLGSAKWGGRLYFTLLLAAAVLIHALSVRLSAAQCRKMLIGFGVAGLIPTLASLAAHYGGADLVGRFMAQGEAMPDLGGMSGAADPLYRLQIANVGATYLFFLMWLAAGIPGPAGRFGMALLGLAGFALSGISGHRISLLYGAVLSVSFILLNVRVPLFNRLVNRYSVGLFFVFLVLVLAAPQLPLLFQRSLSWLPFVSVADAQIDTSVTTLWRIEVWKRALAEAPRYLALGKGFAFSSEDMFSFVHWSMNDYSYVMLIHNYHNGLVQILLDLGLPGLILTAGFVGSVFRRHVRLLAAPWNSPSLRHGHQVLLAGFVAQAVVYLAVGGGANTMGDLFLWAIMLMQAARADADLGKAAEA